MSDKLIIEVRSNEWARRYLNPNIPYTPREIADDAIACGNAGASLVHYHVREPNGDRSMSQEYYSEAARLIKTRNPDLMIMPTLGMGSVAQRAQRIEHVVAMAANPDTKPELAPIDLATCNFDRYVRATNSFETKDVVYLNTPSTWEYFAQTMASIDVKPALVIFDLGSLRAARALVEMGVVRRPVWCELLLADSSFLSGHDGTVKGLQAFLDFFPEGDGWSWSVMSSRGNLLPVAAAAIERGGHVSIGLGDYPYPELGTPNNAALVERVVAMARDMGREVATAAEARKVMNLA